jgi:hypothetical protein
MFGECSGNEKRIDGWKMGRWEDGKIEGGPTVVPAQAGIQVLGCG